MTTTKQIEKIVAEDTFEYYGLRVADGVVVGQVPANSFCWDNGTITEEELPGVSALQIRRGQSVAAVLANTEIYFGDTLALLGSDRAQYGEDEGEIVMVDAEVLMTFSR